jgi:hypothetical protein
MGALGMSENSSEESGMEERAELLSYLALQDTIRWQGPTLALAAQAFLLTIATAKDGTPFTRAVSASLGLFTAIAAIDLVIRKTSQVDSIKEKLSQGEFDNLIRPAIPPSILWLLALGLFGAADLAILTIVIFGFPWHSAALPDVKTANSVAIGVFLASVIVMIVLIGVFFIVHFAVQRCRHK